jgi:hypothetical protein
MKKVADKRGDSIVSRAIAVPRIKRGAKFYIKKFIAKPGAYILVFIAASYGLRQMLIAVDERLAYMIVVVIIGALIFIIAD